MSWERIAVHAYPLLVVAIWTVTAQSVPMCFLTTEYRDSGWCQVFTSGVVKALLIAVLVLSFIHLFTHIYHHRKLTKEIDLRGTKQSHDMTMTDLSETKSLLEPEAVMDADEGLFPGDHSQTYRY